MAQEEFLDIPLPDIIEQWHFYFSVLSPDPGDEIIDVGCDTGDTERLLVREYPKIAKVIGIEKSRARCERAVVRCQNQRIPHQIEFGVADGQNLPFGDCLFCKALCVETLEWIEDSLRVLQEIVRVLKPNGVAVVVHSDFDTQVFSVKDKELCRRVIHSFTDAGPRGQIGRELHALCRSAEFSEVHPLVYTLTNTEWHPNFYAYRVAHMMTEWLTKKSLMPKDELERWIADIEEQYGRGSFFYSINRYICRCVK